jgi:hypothetical protein
MVVKGFDRKILQKIIRLMANRWGHRFIEEAWQASDKPPTAQCKNGHEDGWQVKCQTI